MRIVISGGSGFIGSALRAALRADGHDVVRLVRRRPAEPGEVAWDPAEGMIDTESLAAVDAVVNLSGAGTGDRRWSRAYKRILRESRVRSTAVLASALARTPGRAGVFISASGVGFYGPDRGADLVDETDPAGDGFLAGLCTEWEQAAEPAREAGYQVCHARFGIVMDRTGGALARMLPLFRWGLGGPLGGGEQFWSVVSLHDAVRAIRFLIEQPSCGGPYNITAPSPVSNAEFSRILADVLGRPMLLPVPALALRVAFGDYAEDITGSLRVVPSRLIRAGFSFDHPDARAVVAAALVTSTGRPGSLSAEAPR